jgi:hypothetical protein
MAGYGEIDDMVETLLKVPEVAEQLIGEATATGARTALAAPGLGPTKEV